MKKRKTSLVLLVGIISMLSCSILGLTACGSNANQSPNNNQPVSNQEFTQAVVNGLQAHWTITDAAQQNLSADQFVDAMQKEYDAVKDYENKSFADENMEKPAKDYISAVKDSIDAVSYYDNNSKFEQKYTKEAYPRRCSALYQINKIEPLSVSESQKSDLNDVLGDGELSYASGLIAKNAEFKKEKDKYEGETYHTYSAVVKNTSDIDFSYFSFDINLVDKDGVTVKTTTASTENWKAGSKHRFEFSTDKKFKKIEIQSYDSSR